MRGSVVGVAALVAICLLVATVEPVAAKSRGEKRTEAQKYLRLGQINYDQGRTLEAIEALEKAIDIDPDLAEAHGYLGLIYLQQSDYKQARREFKKAIAINPYYTDGYNSLGIVYREQRKYDDAMAMFEKALQDKAYRTPERIHLNIASTHMAKGDPATAIPHFEKAVALNPTYTLAYLGLGKAYQQTGRKDLADRSLRKVVELAPGSQAATEARQILAQQPARDGA
jgi:Tfp pilus assembly protein PilF